MAFNIEPPHFIMSSAAFLYCLSREQSSGEKNGEKNRKENTEENTEQNKETDQKQYSGGKNSREQRKEPENSAVEEQQRTRKPNRDSVRDPRSKVPPPTPEHKSPPYRSCLKLNARDLYVLFRSNKYMPASWRRSRVQGGHSRRRKSASAWVKTWMAFLWLLRDW